jgi:hypothetical protein
MEMKLKERLTFANVVSVLALFIALGGGAYAASRIPKNSVGTRQLKNNSVNSAKVADQSLTGSDIQSSSLGTVPEAKHAATAGSALPNGAAGGDLTGSYPSPSVAAGSIDSTKVSDGSLTGADLQNDSVTGAQIDESSLGGYTRSYSDFGLNVPANSSLTRILTTAPIPGFGEIFFLCASSKENSKVGVLPPAGTFGFLSENAFDGNLVSISGAGFETPPLGEHGEVRLQYLEPSTGKVGLLTLNFQDNGGADCTFTAQFVITGPKT